MEKMSHPQTHAGKRRNDSRTWVDDSQRVDQIMDVINDKNCRAILEETEGGDQSADDLAEACGLAQSTTYRKINRLLEVDLLDERFRISPTGRHLRTFQLAVTDLQIHVSTGPELEISVSYKDPGDETEKSPGSSLVDQVAD